MLDSTTRFDDWFAVDDNGDVGHFVTAGFRRLPTSARIDAEGLEELVGYFETFLRNGGFTLRPEFEESRPFESPAERARYLKSFAAMAARGLYSYDAELKVPGGYRGVTIPQQPLKLSDLPANIRDRLARTRASISFSIAARVIRIFESIWKSSCELPREEQFGLRQRP